MVAIFRSEWARERVRQRSFRLKGGAAVTEGGTTEYERAGPTATGAGAPSAGWLRLKNGRAAT